jgi:uncharacterized protein
VVNRAIIEYLKKKAASNFGRIVVVTGARQTGKTTLAKHCFSEFEYISLEDPITRPQFTSLSASQWHNMYPSAILDEIQKTPLLIESVKAVYDTYSDSRYILLGSSQILLLQKVRESLAGRAALVELFPLTFPEILTDSWEENIIESKMVRWLRDGTERLDIFDGIPATDERFARVSKIMNEYLRFGAMPAIVDSALDDQEKYDWLYDYVQTYLQRDVRDLANIQDLEPFVRAQKTIAGLTAQAVNLNNLAKLSGVSAPTAKRFLSYLEISYQVLVLQPWYRNLNKRLVKSPKIHFLDPGIQKILLSRRGESTGNEFESAIIAEIVKQIKSNRVVADYFHLRTSDGREVDLLLETEKGFIPIEVKQAGTVNATDARHLIDVGHILDKPVIHSFLLSNDTRIQSLGAGITAMPAAWFLS